MKLHTATQQIIHAVGVMSDYPVHGVDIGFDLSNEYAAAVSMHES